MASPLSRLNQLYFVFQVGSRIPLDDVTICKACCFFHKFCEEEKEAVNLYDLYSVAAACLSLASKVCDDPPASSSLRDIINVSYRNLHPNEPPLQLEEQFYDLRDSLSSMELHLLRVLQFNTDFANSHKYLCHYLLSVKKWMPPASEYHSGSLLLPTALTIHRDIHLCPAVLKYPPQIIALAAIYLAMALLDYELVGFEASSKQSPTEHQNLHSSSAYMSGKAPKKDWFQVFYPDAAKQTLETFCNEFMQLLVKKNESLNSSSNDLSSETL